MDDIALAAGVGLRAVSEIEAGKPTGQFNTWLSVMQALGFRLVVVRAHSPEAECSDEEDQDDCE